MCDPQPGRGSKHALLQSEFLSAIKQGCGPFPEPLTMPEGSEVEDLTGHSIWTALSALLQRRHWESGEQQLLESYRLAFCSACESPDRLQRLADLWSRRLQNPDLEDLPIDSVVKHGRVAHWVCCNLSVTWLVPEHQQPRVHNATFRQSIASLAALDLGSVVVELPPLDVPSHCLVICSAERARLLNEPLGFDALVITLEECGDEPQWCDRVWSHLQKHPGCLLAICLAGIKASVLPLQPPVRAKSSRAPPWRKTPCCSPLRRGCILCPRSCFSRVLMDRSEPSLRDFGA